MDARRRRRVLGGERRRKELRDVDGEVDPAMHSANQRGQQAQRGQGKLTRERNKCKAHRRRRTVRYSGGGKMAGEGSTAITAIHACIQRKETVSMCSKARRSLCAQREGLELTVQRERRRAAARPRCLLRRGSLQRRLEASGFGERVRTSSTVLRRSSGRWAIGKWMAGSSAKLGGSSSAAMAGSECLWRLTGEGELLRFYL
jgi:hypothetical protein